MVGRPGPRPGRRTRRGEDRLRGMTTVTIEPLDAGSRRAVASLLDDVVGAGFHDVDDVDPRLSFVARDTAGEVVGVVLADLDTPGPVLHLRQLAVAAGARRQGVARRLLARAEDAGEAAGAGSVVTFAWLPHGLPEPPSVPTYLAAGYTALRDVPGFYAASSLETGARCPYCGEPPCRCSVRVLTKPLTAGAESG
jgi:GNAT superfamily N-acetyltransferase